MKNREIILTIGIPGSGKSTWCEEFIKKNPEYVRICRDSVRWMMQKTQIMDRRGESLVTKMVDHLIYEATRSGYNVIVDQTNVKKKRLEEFIEKCRRYGDVSFRVFDVSKRKALERDKNREFQVGKEVIERMFQSYRSLVNSGFDFRKRKMKEELLTSVDQDPNLPHGAIVDVDGTIAQRVDRSPFDWDRVDEDLPKWDVINMVKALSTNYNIVFVSGRDAVCREKTLKWIKEHFGWSDITLFMRPEGNDQKDSIIKKNIFFDKVNPQYYIDLVVDDRDQVVQMWREEMGLTCVQVAYGNF